MRWPLHRRRWVRALALALAGFAIGVLGSAAVSRAAAVSEAAAAAYNDGNRYFRDALYSQAVERYEAASAMGARDARLEYNWACALARLGDVGRARLHLERAIRLAPGDEDAAHNLAALLGRIEGEERPLDPESLRWVSRPGWGFPPATLALGALGFWCAGWLLWALRPWVGGLALQRALGYGRVIFLALLAGVLAIFYASRRDFDRSLAVVVSGPVAVQTGPGPAERNVGTLAAGRRVYEVRAQGTWAEVRASGELEGWVPRDTLEAIVP